MVNKIIKDKRGVAFSTTAIVLGLIAVGVIAFFVLKFAVSFLQQIIPYLVVGGLIIGAIIVWRAVKSSNEPTFKEIRRRTGIRKSRA